MLGAGATSTSATPPDRSYGCLTCGAKFNSSAAQRAHMKGDWHVSNLKRRIASQAPTSEADFHAHQPPSDTSDTPDTQTSPAFERSCAACAHHYTSRRAWHAHLRSRTHAQTHAEPHVEASIGADDDASPAPSSSDDASSSDEQDADPSPTHCLFCPLSYPALEANLSHMAHAHSFFLPPPGRLADTTSLLGYLHALIAVSHECLACGTRRSSKAAVQDHMRGRGHCRVDVHQLGQFYDVPDGGEEGGEPGGEDELRLPSGKVLGRREAHHRHPRRPPRSASPAQQRPPAERDVETSAAGSQERRLVMRAGTSTSLVGVSDVRLRALRAVEVKMEKVEARARNEYWAGVERGGNRQKRFRVLSMGKKAGGLERRLG